MINFEEHFDKTKNIELIRKLNSFSFIFSFLFSKNYIKSLSFFRKFFMCLFFYLILFNWRKLINTFILFWKIGVFLKKYVSKKII